jgi:ribosomal protein L11 methyltransferase
MAWIAAELMLDAETVTPFSDALLELGAESIEITDARSGTQEEQAIYMEPGMDAAFVWGESRLIALFAEGAKLAEVFDQAARAAGLSAVPDYRTSPVGDEDWVRLTQAQFEPIRVSERLWIVPSWHTAPDPDAINLVLDPGLAFGTGGHPTTLLCLQWIDANLRPGQTMIDYGCGSGILAIAGGKIGATQVLGVDIDVQALEASRYNAKHNAVNARFVDAHMPEIEPADVVIANILSGPLKVLAPLLSRITRCGGRLVLSGILEAQTDELTDIYGRWFDMQVPVSLEGWVRLEGVRRLNE